MAVEVSTYVPASESETGEGYTITSTTALGLTVEITSTYLGDGDSVYSAVCWDQDKGAFVSRGGDYYPRGMKVDASEELLALYQGLKAAEKALGNAKYALDRYRARVFEEEREAAEPTKGKVVEVVKGRKVKVGTIGTVKWYGQSTYGGYRVGLAVPGTEGLVYTSADNVEVVPAGRLGVAA